MTTPPPSTPVTALARRFRVEIDMSTTETPNWQVCPGVVGFGFTADPNIEDSTEYDMDGWTSNTKTAQEWEATLTFNRKMDKAATAYSPVHEKIRKAWLGAYGAASEIHLRWYDRNGLPEAYEGWAIPAWEPQNDEATDLDQVEVTFTGNGPLLDIANPGAPAGLAAKSLSAKSA